MLIGHSQQWKELLEKGRKGELHHAELFIGPEHVGKTKLAMLLAMELQCPDDTLLVTRKHILEGADPDTLLFLDDGEILPIEKVRELLIRTSLSHQKPYLVVVLENLGRLKTETANALLKTLEEPAPGVLFFLTAHREEDVLPTIRSRCHVTRFQTVSDQEILKACQGHPSQEELAMFAVGRPGKLMQLINDHDYFSTHQSMHRDLTHFLDNPSLGEAMSLVRSYEKNPLLPELLDILLHRVRTWALLQKQDAPVAHVSAADMMEKIEIGKDDLKQNVNARLVLENLLLPFAP